MKDNTDLVPTIIFTILVVIAIIVFAGNQNQAPPDPQCVAVGNC